MQQQVSNTNHWSTDLFRKGDKNLMSLVDAVSFYLFFMVMTRTLASS